MSNNAIEKSEVETVFSVIGSPFHGADSKVNVSPEAVDTLFDFTFENRVALLFLTRCREKGINLTERSEERFGALEQRRLDTERTIVKLAQCLDEKARGRWTLFKTVKPFPSTPNDTDWFPFDTNEHQALCNHLLSSGFSFLEEAPLQTTLIDESGVGLADSDKRGGVWYIDCYRAPGADYFKYLDPAKLKRHLVTTNLQGYEVPNLASPAELIAICFHNVFPERTYSIESFYLILHYLHDMHRQGLVEEFKRTAAENRVTRAVSANLSVTRAIHQKIFGSSPQLLDELCAYYDIHASEGEHYGTQGGELPYNFSGSCFWSCFREKLREPLALKSLFVQAFHMLNPVFAYGVFEILVKRMRKGSIYKQM